MPTSEFSEGIGVARTRTMSWLNDGCSRTVVSIVPTTRKIELGKSPPKRQPAQGLEALPWWHVLWSDACDASYPDACTAPW